jgi:hypothetical protein
MRPSDAPSAKVIPPTPEIFPGGSTEEPWSSSPDDPSLEFEYRAGGAYAATDGDGEISIRVDGEDRDPIDVTYSGLQELTIHERTERHTLELEPSSGLLIYSIQFAAAVPG